jgi:hypothetical protein
MSSIVNNQKLPRSYSTSQLNTPLARRRLGAAFVLGNADTATNGGRATPTKTTIKGAKKGPKGGKKGHTWRPHHVIIVTDNGGSDEEAGDSGEDCVVDAEHDFMCQT